MPKHRPGSKIRRRTIRFSEAEWLDLTESLVLMNDIRVKADKPPYTLTDWIRLGLAGLTFHNRDMTGLHNPYLTPETPLDGSKSES